MAQVETLSNSRHPGRAQGSRGWLSRWLAEIVVISGVIGTALAVSTYYRTLGSPELDDWAYLLSLQNLVLHGTLNLEHWGTIFVVGQLFLVAPLYLVAGVHPLLADAWTVGMTAVFLGAVAWLAARLGVGRLGRVGLLLGVGASSVVLCESVSFMTDIPAIALATLALSFWAASLEKVEHSLRWTCLALGIALLAFTIREPAGLVAVPILAEVLWSSFRNEGRVGRRNPLVVTGLFMVACCTLWWLRSQVPDGGWQPPTRVGLLAANHVQSIGLFIPLMGSLLAGFIILAVSGRMLLAACRRSPLAAAAAITVGILVPTVMALGTSSSLWRWQMGNQFALCLSMPGNLKLVVFGIACCSASAGLTFLFSIRHAWPTLTLPQRRLIVGLLVFAGLYVLFLVVMLSARQPVFDRYFLPPFVAIAMVIAALATSNGGKSTQDPESPRLLRLGRYAVLAIFLLVSIGSFAQHEASRSAAWWSLKGAIASKHVSPLDIQSLWYLEAYDYGAAIPADRWHPLASHRGAWVAHAGGSSSSHLYMVQGAVAVCGKWQQVILMGPLLTSPREGIGVVRRSGPFDDVWAWVVPVTSDAKCGPPDPAFR